MERKSCLHFLLEPFLASSSMFHFELRAPLKLCAEEFDFVTRTRAPVPQSGHCLHSTFMASRSSETADCYCSGKKSEHPVRLPLRIESRGSRLEHRAGAVAAAACARARGGIKFLTN